MGIRTWAIQARKEKLNSFHEREPMIRPGERNLDFGGWWGLLFPISFFLVYGILGWDA